MCLFLGEKKDLKSAKRVFNKMLEGIAFSAGIKKTLQRMLKNGNGFGYVRKIVKNPELHKQQIYREYILLTLCFVFEEGHYCDSHDSISGTYFSNYRTTIFFFNRRTNEIFTLLYSKHVDID